MAVTASIKAAVLNSWKEIAVYISRGVRTVQRWEHDLGLPVHRPKGRDRSAVLALTSEIDDWLARTPVRSWEQGRGVQKACPSASVAATTRQCLRGSLQTSALLRREMRTQLQQQREAAHRLISTVQKSVGIANGSTEPRRK